MLQPGQILNGDLTFACALKEMPSNFLGQTFPFDLRHSAGTEDDLIKLIFETPNLFRVIRRAHLLYELVDAIAYFRIVVQRWSIHGLARIRHQFQCTVTDLRLGFILSDLGIDRIAARRQTIAVWLPRARTGALMRSSHSLLPFPLTTSAPSAWPTAQARPCGRSRCAARG